MKSTRKGITERMTAMKKIFPVGVRIPMISFDYRSREEK